MFEHIKFLNVSHTFYAKCPIKDSWNSLSNFHPHNIFLPQIDYTHLCPSQFHSSAWSIVVGFTLQHFVVLPKESLEIELFLGVTQDFRLIVYGQAFTMCHLPNIFSTSVFFSTASEAAFFNGAWHTSKAFHICLYNYSAS